MNTFDAWNEMEKERKQRKHNAPCSKWISVKERLPEEGEVVLVFGGRSIYTAIYGWRCGWYGWHKLNSKYHNCNPTHWMPLPEPPKEGGGEDG